ncbi:MAG: PspC domain-containing protein [Sphingomicrobium sp.]
MNTQDNPVSLPMRHHTILGVCEAIGEDFGFNPTYLRVPFAATVLYSPTYAVLAYFALGLVVLMSRLLFPKARPASVELPLAEAAEAPANEQHALAKAA